MTYEIGQKVETPLGVGTVTAIERNTLIAVNIGKLPIDYIGIVFKESDIKPYKTAHEKLIEMGYEYNAYRWGDNESRILYVNDELPTISIDNGRTISCDGFNLELSSILTQYLEESNEK